MEVDENVVIDESKETQEVVENNEPQAFDSPDDLMDAVHGIGKYAPKEDTEGLADTEEVQEDTETKSEDIILDEKRAEELLGKSEKEGLTDEEAKELEEMGYVEEKADESNTDKDPLAVEEEVEAKEEEVWEAPSYVDQLNELYPDSSFEKAEDVEDAVYSLIADQKANNEANKNLEIAIQEDPEFASFIEAVVVKKKSVAEAANEAGIDFSEAIPEPGEDGYDEYIIAREERKKATKRATEFKLKRDQNLQKSVVKVKRFFSENNITQEDAGKIGDELDKVYEGIYNGDVPEKLIQFIYDGMKAPEQIKNAETMGRLKGRNEQIVTKRRTFRKGDGTKKLGGSKTSIQSQPKVEYADDGIKDLLRVMDIEP